MNFGIIKDNITDQDIEQFTKIFNQYKIFSPTIYTNLLNKRKRNSLNIVQQLGAYSHTGILVATNITEAGKLNNCFGHGIKIFYSLNRDWITVPNLQYETIRTLYQNENIVLAVPTKDDVSLYSNLFSRKVLHWENWDEKFLEKINERR